MKKYQVSVVALQETKAQGIIFKDKNGRHPTMEWLLLFEMTSKFSQLNMSDRIALISIVLNNQRTYSIQSPYHHQRMCCPLHTCTKYRCNYSTQAIYMPKYREFHGKLF
jgi:hypothetical protein